MAGPEKQDANLVGFYKAREVTLGNLSPTPNWATREPNSFDDLGGEYTKVARRPFNPSRQRKKGSTTDLDADGGYNEDLTQNNMQGELEEFMFARIRSALMGSAQVAFSKAFTVNATTDVATVTGGHGLANGAGPFYVSSAGTLPTGLVVATPYWANVTGATTFKFASSRDNALAGTTIDLTDTGTGIHTAVQAPAVSATTDTYIVSGAVPDLPEGSKILVAGFAEAANNGVKTVVSNSAFAITVAETLVDEAAAPVGAGIKLVAITCPEDDLSLEVIELTPGTVSGVRIVSDSINFNDYNLTPGSWLFLGGDETGQSFVDADDAAIPGYARIANDGISIDGTSVTFDKTTFPAIANDGVDLAVVIWLSDVLKNEEDPELIVRFSSTIERTLGKDADGTQSEYLTGAIANELTWNSPLANLVNLDLSYVGQKAGTRKGVDGPLSRRVGNTISRALGEDAFNTSSNIYRIRMGMIDPETLNPSPLFARVTEWTMSINNNVAGAKAQGTLGSFDATVGGFDVDGEFTAYFSNVDAIHAVKCNWDITFDAIYAKRNAAVYMDVPLISLGGGRLNIEQDAAIMLPIETAAAESAFGHTLLVGWFPLLPNVAMPDQDC